jgi:YhcH/YjgK/YiaL family protein
MIIDQLGNANLYVHINNRLAVALRYLQSMDLSAFENGTYEIEDREIYYSVNEYNTKSINEAKWEAHQKYADIHYIISGAEKMGFSHFEALEVSENYNPEKDVTFLKGTGDYITLKPGSFAIFFPHDAHQPGVAVSDTAPVKKLVVKVMV